MKKTKAMHAIQLLMDKYNSGKIININRMTGGYTNISYKVSTDKRDSQSCGCSKFIRSADIIHSKKLGGYWFL